MIPTIDDAVRYRGASFLRELSTDYLRRLHGAVVIQDAEALPLVVIVPYETYLELQLEAKAQTPKGPPSKSVARRLESQGPKKVNKRDAAIQARAEGDLTAQAVGREDLDYSDTESTPTTHVTKVRQQKTFEQAASRTSMADWRSNRKPLLKQKDKKKE